MFTRVVPLDYISTLYFFEPCGALKRHCSQCQVEFQQTK